MYAKHLLAPVALLATLASNDAWSGGSVTDVPGVEDGPALSSYAERNLSLGFADVHGVNGDHAQGDRLSFSALDGDGNPVSFQMDPISGETISADAASKPKQR